MVGSSYAASSYIGDNRNVVSALFSDSLLAQEAVRELRDIGIPAASISLIARDEEHASEPEMGGAGVDREEIADEGLTYRASSELPNDEDLPTTEAEQTGRDVPVFTDFEVPPDEPLGGSDRLGLSRDADMVRRNEADTNADEDIYTDFPDEPGGVNPEAPTSGDAKATQQAAMRDRASAAGNAAKGAGIGSFAGLLIGVAGLAIPGVGPFIAAGPIAGALSGSLAGGAAGGIIGAISGAGVPEEYAREYAARLEQGETLVSVRADELSCDPVERVLTAHGGHTIH